MTAFATPAGFLAALRGLPQADAAARSAAIARQGELTKPPGSLGRLEDIAVFMAGWQGNPLPRLDRGSADGRQFRAWRRGDQRAVAGGGP
jgi:nicotinate-nucleotide--dimethylbenzimidazole phosphoribosyltransferase